MSYAKVPKACRDYAVGFQDVNQVGYNYAASYDALYPQHGTSGLAPQVHGHPWARLGRHSHATIPRLVGRFSLLVTQFATLTQSSLTEDCTYRVARLETGVYYVLLYDVLRSYVVTRPEYTASTQHRFTTAEAIDSVGSNPGGWKVRTYEGTSWALTDYTWHLWIYATTEG